MSHFAINVCNDSLRNAPDELDHKELRWRVGIIRENDLQIPLCPSCQFKGFSTRTNQIDQMN